MSFTINSFRQGIQSVGGVARPNLFEVVISDAPDNFPTTGFPFQCKIATIPPSTMGVIEVPYFGRMIKIPGNRTFDNLSVTILNDENYTIRNGVEKWMQRMNDHKTNTSRATMESIQAQITISHYKVNGQSTGQGWKFVDAFPVALSEIALDWGSNDTAEEFTIDFAYDYWTSTATKGSGGPGGAGRGRGN